MRKKRLPVCFATLVALPAGQSQCKGSLGKPCAQHKSVPDPQDLNCVLEWFTHPSLQTQHPYTTNRIEAAKNIQDRTFAFQTVVAGTEGREHGNKQPRCWTPGEHALSELLK